MKKIIKETKKFKNFNVHLVETFFGKEKEPIYSIQTDYYKHVLGVETIVYNTRRIQLNSWRKIK